MQNLHHSDQSTQRVEAFSDGVFAIAITLLVLEIRVPEGIEGVEPAVNLGAALLRLWPSYFGYVFSFVMIGIYWADHHYIFNLYKRTDHIFVLLNILFLMCISFLPFPTAVLAKYITDVHQQQTAIVLYTLGLFLPAFSWLLIWIYASWQNRLIDKQLDERFAARVTRQYSITNVLYFSAILLALWNGTAGLALCVGLSLLYLLPNKRPFYRSAESGTDARS